MHKLDDQDNYQPPNCLSIDDRRLIIYGPIDEQLSTNVSMFFPQLDQQRDAPIYITINSPGGSLMDTQTIVTEILRCENEVHCDITGIAFSGAAMIALACDFCKISKLGMFMLHYPNWETESMSLHEHKLDVKVMSEYFFRIMDTLFKDTKLTTAEFKKLVEKGDLYLTPKKCLKLGFVQEIY